MNRLPIIAVVLLCGIASPLRAEEKNPEKSAAKLITPAVQHGIDCGLKWLVSQQRDDGSFNDGSYRGNVAVCALAGMAMTAEGSTPGRGPYGANVSRCVDYLLANTQPSGFICGPNSTYGPMYGHGFATMFLAECYGMSPRPELREKLSKAVKIIVNSQNKQGGWRYQPVRETADISVTVCQVMALRAAGNAGIYVPNEVVDRAREYVKRSQNADGGFMYMLSNAGESDFPRSAAAVVALYSAGIYKGPEIAKGLDYLMRFIPAEGVTRREMYFFYGHYYAMQAFWQAGGERFARWYTAVSNELVSRQREDGSWQAAQEGNTCATAMACIALEIPNNYLPIFQR
jgi:squalene cyclase